MSPFSIQAMGLDIPPYNTRGIAMGNAGMASIEGYGASISNPSKTAFNRKTTFQAIFESDLNYLEDNETSNTMSSTGIPFVGFNFQAGKFGHLGFIYFQRFEKKFSYTPLTSSSPYIKRLYQGGIFEIVTTYARSLGRNHSIGLSYHFLWGQERSIESVDFTSSNQSQFQDLIGDTTEVRWPGSYPAFSYTGRYQRFNIAFRASVPLGYQRQAVKKIYAVETESNTVQDFTLPMALSAGVSYKKSDNEEFVADFSTSDWDQSLEPGSINRAFHFGLGYEYSGTGGQYDSYYKKLKLRGGTGYERLYVREVDVYKLAIGAGVPLGTRGSLLDVAVEYGHRGDKQVHAIQEDYVKLSIGLTGMGVWGRSSRRK
jgi:long-chain fatty acid transport protein